MEWFVSTDGSCVSTTSSTGSCVSTYHGFLCVSSKMVFAMQIMYLVVAKPSAHAIHKGPCVVFYRDLSITSVNVSRPRTFVLIFIPPNFFFNSLFSSSSFLSLSRKVRVSSLPDEEVSSYLFFFLFFFYFFSSLFLFCSFFLPSFLLDGGKGSGWVSKLTLFFGFFPPTGFSSDLLLNLIPKYCPFFLVVSASPKESIEGSACLCHGVLFLHW